MQIPELFWDTEVDNQVWKVMAIVCTVATGILFFVIIAMATSINTTMRIIKEATKTITKVPALLLYVGGGQGERE